MFKSRIIFENSFIDTLAPNIKKYYFGFWLFINVTKINHKVVFKGIKKTKTFAGNYNIYGININRYI